MAKREPNPDIVNMVRAISNGKNVDAYKLLEKITRQKVADKIDAALEEG